MNRRALAALVVVSATVLAGCGAFGGTPTPSAEPETASTTPSPTVTPTATAARTPDSRVTLLGDSPVNATRVWERVASLFAGEYDPPTVVVRDGGSSPQVPPFATHLGLDEGAATFGEGIPTGSYYPSDGSVQILLLDGSEMEVERVLSHEYAHAIQHQAGLLDQANTRDTTEVRGAIVEGSASYVEDAYTRRFLGFSSLNRTCERYVDGSPYARYSGQPYCFGGRYFAAQLDSPSDLTDSDLRLPNTTEQVLHPERTEPPANLTVVAETDTPTSFDRRGELFVRTVLGVELDEERAREAAAGWGNDRLVHVTGETQGYVWVLRSDTESDAAEFESAFEAYLDARGERSADGWRADGERYRLSTVDDRTVAVVTGNGTFVDTTSVARQDGNVTVSTG